MKTQIVTSSYNEKIVTPYFSTFKDIDTNKANILRGILLQTCPQRKGTTLKVCMLDITQFGFTRNFSTPDFYLVWSTVKTPSFESVKKLIKEKMDAGL
jgi:hypothetical protein